MNIEETKKAIEVMQAYVDGKTIIRHTSGELDSNGTSTVEAHWRWENDSDIYFVKPEPIERWIAVFDSGGIAVATHMTKKSALAQYCAVDAIKLVEAE